MKANYIIYNPAGNITALVIGDNYTSEERKIINDKIMEKEQNVEQVGFLSETKKRLTMAGGEFCGNATRCAVSYYLKEDDNIEIEICGRILKAGRDENKNIWCEIPIGKYKIEKLDENIYQVVIEGITIIVVKDTLFKNYCNKDLKVEAMNIKDKYNIDDEAVGVMFCDKEGDLNKMYPAVWVKSIDTLFLENACGSGTIGVTMLETFLSNKSGSYKVKQPSGDILQTEIEIEDGIITRAVLKGDIKTDGIIKNIEY